MPLTAVLLFTDGLVERRDRDIETRLGELTECLSRHATDDLETPPDAVLEELAVGEAPSDDIALLAIRVERVGDG